MANATMSPLNDLPPLPGYTLQPVSPLVLGIPDKYFSLLAPIIGYWVMSGIFHVIDEYDLFPQYRLHTPVELLRRNRASKYEVLRDVLIQQVIQTVFGVGMGYFEPDNMAGREQYDIAVWATRLRLAQRWLPSVLTAVGLDAAGLSLKALQSGHGTLAGVLAGGRYLNLTESTTVGGTESAVPVFAPWELFASQAIYHVVVPFVQFLVAILIVDTWQYFLHRAMHMNKYLYTTLHSRHHRLYVPYAYGALYNHPGEGFLLDTLGTGLAYLVTGMTARQGMLFFTGSSVKTVDDHCGYVLPWDPLQHLTSNNAGYHDIHHQSWGIKTNFSQPFFTFWDRILGTMWTGGDVSARYARDSANAQRLFERDAAKVKADGQPDSISHSNAQQSLTEDLSPYESEASSAKHLTSDMQDAALPSVPSGKATAQAIGSREQILEDRQGGGPSVLADEAEEEIEALEKANRRAGKSTRRSTSESLKGLRERVDGKLRGRARDVMKVESS